MQDPGSLRNSLGFHQLFDKELKAQKQIMNEVVVKRLISSQFLQRAHEERNCYIRVPLTERLNAKIDLLL
jgi:hypothetical protein